MNCRELTNFLMDYLEGELPEEERIVFDSHLHDCPACLAYLESYRQTVAVGRLVCEDPCGEIPEEVPKQLIEAILAARGRGKSTSSRE
jgi:anti-sigma factor RsiW